MAEGDTPDDRITAQIAEGVSALDSAQWDALNASANPFVSHAFLAALEESGSVGPGTGWSPAPIILRDENGDICGALPAYLKSHSQGEYVFDHAWADAYERAGGRYYPKLQIAAPFSPVPGPRVLARDDETALRLLRAAESVVLQNGLSSAHATFVDEGQLDLFRKAGWLIRSGTQFHWANDGYSSFDGFMATLASRKRRAIRKERAAAQSQVEIEILRGDQILPEHWDMFWVFYQDTGARKWGRPYLTREFFDLVAKSMRDSIVLFLAHRDGQPVAGALNLLGPDCLYGRYWGCVENIPFLHFELCYYQAIDFAIAHGLARVEAGAQGEHKLARGYLPVTTWSAHFIADPGFREVIEDFLGRERRAVEREQEFLGELGPFKRG
ncbi:MAG: GNAT family N-acetyltransferase [Sphingorhabdus sp.]|uniref:GNAT family N-acetyltransferase n=1 Tax=Sphingorhabdus sp. TaxID=1902408 RepID=UPI003CB016E8